MGRLSNLAYQFGLLSRFCQGLLGSTPGAGVAVLNDCFGAGRIRGQRR
jgi:hypothetical protein